MRTQPFRNLSGEMFIRNAIRFSTRRLNPDNSSYNLADPESINQIGCIHTIQGLDLQYAGVIIGKDMVYRDGKIQFDKKANVDNYSAKISSVEDKKAIKYIRNTYNVLLTRGMRGTFIYCEDKALSDYLKSLLE